MTTKVKGTEGIEFPDASVQATAADAGPAFSAYQSSSQGNLPAAVSTKLLFQTKEFDTAGAFANSRFTPQVAGYYHINGCLQVTPDSTGLGINLYKNGAQVKNGNYIVGGIVIVSAIVYLNGTTDYVELFGFSLNSVPPVATSNGTYFQGFLARRAAP